MKIKEAVLKAAAIIHERRTLLIYAWAVLAILNSAAVHVVGIVCGGILIAAWAINKATKGE